MRIDARRIVRLPRGGVAKLNFAVKGEPRTGRDCCGDYDELDYLELPVVEKKLDIALRSVDVQEGSRVRTLTFDVASNYLESAPCLELRLFEDGKVFHSQTVEPAAQRSSIEVDSDRDQLSYALYAHVSCDSTDDLGAADWTRRHTVELPDERAEYPEVSLESSLQQDVIDANSNGQAFNFIFARDYDQSADTAFRIGETITSAEATFESLSSPGWEIIGTPDLPVPKRASVEIANDVPQIGEADEVARVRRATPLGPESVRFEATNMTAAMECCGVDTALEPVLDIENSVYALRFTNRGGQHDPTVVACLDFGGAATGGCRGPERAVAPAQTIEFYLGDFDALGPAARRDWTTMHVRVRTLAGDRNADPLQCTRCDVMSYRVVREREEEAGHLRPPRITKQCMGLESVPQVTEDGLVSSLRVSDQGEELTVPPRSTEGLALDEWDFGVAVLDFTVGRDSVGHLDDEYVEGRVAAFWRGYRSLERDVGAPRDLEWTVQLDTTKDDLENFTDNLKKKDPNRLFRQLDADHYYPTYGDDSTTELLTDTQGAFYAKIAVDESHALWGNYVTGFTGTEFAHFNRSLYGAQARFASEGRTPFGEPVTSVTLFGSEAQSAPAHAEFQATGGSMYYLRHTDIVMGSEKVWIEVRRRDTEQIEEREPLVAGRDYEVDPLQGRILLRRPLSQVVRERTSNVIRTTPLEGDDVFLLVDYEYVPEAFAADDYVLGLRGKAWLDDVALGVTSVSDDQAGADYTMHGLDVVWRVKDASYVSAELVRSETSAPTANVFSFDGGLTFDAALPSVNPGSADGDATGFEGVFDLADFSDREDMSGMARVWWKERESGFSSGRYRLGPETTDTGVEFELDKGQRWTVTGGATELERAGEQRVRVARLQGSRRWACGDDRRACQLDLEGRHEDIDVDSPGSFVSRGAASLLGVRLSREVSEERTVYARAQSAVETDDGYEDNDLIALGTNVRRNDRLGYSFEANSGDRGHALLAGVDYSPSPASGFNVSSGVGSGAISQFSTRYTLFEGYELYGSYAVNPDRTEGERNMMTLGQRRDLGQRMKIFTESQFGHDDRQVSKGHVFGVEYDLAERWVVSSTVQASRVERASTEFDRVAVSVGGIYRRPDLRFSTRVEIREDQGPTTDLRQYVSSNAFAYQVDPDWRVQGKLNLAWLDDEIDVLDVGRFVEFDLGYAYRPIETDKWNWFARYGYLYDVGTRGQVDSSGDERSNVLSVEGMYQSTRRLRLGGKIAYRKGASRMQKGIGEWFDLNLGLGIARAVYELDVLNEWGLDSRSLELHAEYRWLRDFEGDSESRGALLGIYKQFGRREVRSVRSTYRVGVGYNFSGFDDDMRRDRQRSHGWFLDLMAVF